MRSHTSNYIFKSCKPFGLRLLKNSLAFIYPNIQSPLADYISSEVKKHCSSPRLNLIIWVSKKIKMLC